LRRLGTCSARLPHRILDSERKCLGLGCAKDFCEVPEEHPRAGMLFLSWSPFLCSIFSCRADHCGEANFSVYFYLPRERLLLPFVSREVKNSFPTLPREEPPQTFFAQMPACRSLPFARTFIEETPPPFFFPVHRRPPNPLGPQPLSEQVFGEETVPRPFFNPKLKNQTSPFS